MRAATLIVSAVALAWWLRSRAEPTGRGDADAPQGNVDASGDFVGPPDPWWLDMPSTDSTDGPYDPRDVTTRRFAPSQLSPSQNVLDMLKRRERLSLTRYELGDGGVTVGYGHYEPYSRAHLVPQTVTREWAEATFLNDVESRGARWVRQYVITPLTQNEFDAMVHIAFNLSPRSFKRIADALNAGGDWRAVAKEYVRPDAPHLTQGLINRRNEEIALFDQGMYS